MPMIHPILDLETNSDVAVMNMDSWEEMDFENEIYQKLVEAQAEARSNPKRLSHDEVFSSLRKKIASYKDSL